MSADVRRHIVIGDIHGCYDELRALLDRIGPTSEDQIIALGDLVDRGPQSERVLEFFRDTPNAVSIIGNHEYVHLNAGRANATMKLSHKVARRELAERYDDWVGFMAGFPRMIELDEAIIVHAALEPAIEMADQREDVMVGLKTGEKHLKTAYNAPWYDLYDGAKPVIVGHHDYGRDHQPLIRENRVYAIDTGAVRGGQLTALILPDFELISVPSKADYWGRAKSQRLKP